MQIAVERNMGVSGQFLNDEMEETLFVEYLPRVGISHS